MNNQHDSTYALLIRSEEKSRGVMEALLYGLIALSTVISICQFARQPSPLPIDGLSATSGEHRTSKQIAS